MVENQGYNNYTLAFFLFVITTHGTHQGQIKDEWGGSPVGQDLIPPPHPFLLGTP